jgi:hypothetical protein
MAVMEKTRGGRAASMKAEEKRKKMILAGGSVLLVALMVFQVPRVLKQLNPPTVAAPASSSASTDPTATGVPGAGGAVPQAASPVRSPLLSKMKTKDPFVPLIREKSSVTGAEPSSSGTAPASSPSSPSVGFKPGSSTGTGQTASAAPASPVAAVIWINDRPQVVGLTKRFPAGAPTFKLVSVSGKLIKIRVAGGSFADGRKVMTIRKGRGITLVNTTTGVRYDIRFAAPTVLLPTLTPPAS